MLAHDKEKEAEVHAAYKKFKKARRRAKKEGTAIPLDSILGQQFQLFSSEHTRIPGAEHAASCRKGASFFDLGNISLGTEESEETMVSGQVYLDSEANSNLESRHSHFQLEPGGNISRCDTSTGTSRCNVPE